MGEEGIRLEAAMAEGLGRIPGQGIPPSVKFGNRGGWAGMGTYSADFQKWPGWERRRLRFGSFSSMSMSLVKVGLSSCS